MKRFAITTVVALSLAAMNAHAQEPFSPPTEEPPPPPLPPATETPPTDTTTVTVMPPPKPKEPTPLGFRIDGGWSPHYLYDLTVGGADVALGIGPRVRPNLAIWVVPRIFVGSTENGLGVWSGALGAEIEGIVDRFRFGGGVGLFVMGVHRAVRHETLLSWGPDLHAALRFDVVQSDDFALFARAAINGSYEFFGGSWFWGPTLGAGVEFDINGKRTPPPAAAKATSRTGSAAD